MSVNPHFKDIFNTSVWLTVGPTSYNLVPFLIKTFLKSNMLLHYLRSPRISLSGYCHIVVKWENSASRVPEVHFLHSRKVMDRVRRISKAWIDSWIMNATPSENTYSHEGSLKASRMKLPPQPKWTSMRRFWSERWHSAFHHHQNITEAIWIVADHDLSDLFIYLISTLISHLSVSFIKSQI